MKCWLLRTLQANPSAICINQDVPTCFYAVQRSRLPIIIMLLDRGLSDTNKGEVNLYYYSKNLLVSDLSPSLCPFKSIGDDFCYYSTNVSMETIGFSYIPSPSQITG
jgi:hypothetical protein